MVVSSQVMGTGFGRQRETLKSFDEPERWPVPLSFILTRTHSQLSHNSKGLSGKNLKVEGPLNLSAH